MSTTVAGRLRELNEKIKQQAANLKSTIYRHRLLIGVILFLVLGALAIGIAALILSTNVQSPTDAQNLGLMGIGVFNSKTGNILGFNNIAGGSSKVNVALDTPNKAVDVDVVPNQLGAVCINTGTGLSGGSCVTLNSTMTLSVTPAQTLTTLSVSQTTFLGTTTTCVNPLQPSCYDISQQSCPGGPLQQNCLPSTAFFNALTVGTLTVTNSSSGGGGSINATNPVLNGATLTGPLVCTANATVSQGCLNLGGYVCPNGVPMSESCIPASVSFVNLTSTNLFTVNNVQCAGPKLPSSCVQSPYSSTVLGTPSPLNLAMSTTLIDLLGPLSSNGYDMVGMHLFPVATTISSITLNGVIGSSWTAGCFTVELYYTTAGAVFATSSSLCFNGVTTQTVGSRSVFSSLATVAGTLAVPAATPFFARIRTSVLTCSDLRLSVIVNAVSQ
jgi:hypothetical protein